MTSKWADDGFLDSLSQTGDRAADAVVAALDLTGSEDATATFFALMRYNGQPIPSDAPPALREFWAQTAALPAGVDLDRVARGERAFMNHIFDFGALMLVRSLPAGYAAPRLSQVLCISNDLGRAPLQRVMAVVQLLMDIGGGKGFREGGKAVVAAQKMRLLHAGVRHVTRRWLPGFERELGGVPASIEDMLGTLMGFSYLVIDGLQQLEGSLSAQEAEDVYYLWQVYAVMAGLHPPIEPGQQPGFDWIPADLDEARTFYEAYSRRHYVAADANPEGVYLAAADLQMMVGLLPWTLRLLGFGLVPRLLMQDSLGEAAMRRVGLRPLPFNGLLKRIYLDLPLALDRFWHRTEAGNAHAHFAERILGDMVTQESDGEITFAVPFSRADLEALAKNQARPCLQRRAQAEAAERPSRPMRS